jgi:hypothetical protein
VTAYFCYELFLDTYLWLYFWIFLILFAFLNRKKIFAGNLLYVFLFVVFSLAFVFDTFLVANVNATPAWLVSIIKLNLDRSLLIIPPSAGFLMFASFSSRAD